MKTLLIFLLLIVIIGQSFSLHKCRNDVKLIYSLKGKQVFVRVINGNTTFDRVRSLHLETVTFYGKEFIYDELLITGGNP